MMAFWNPWKAAMHKMLNRLPPLVCLCALLAAALFLLSPRESRTGRAEPVFERVMRAQILRCGYVPWEPYIIKDANTGHITGLYHDYMEALGKALGLKIDWAAEVGYGDIAVALEAGRIDAMCNGIWPNAARARRMDFGRPIAFNPIHVYARADDNRFDGSLAAIDDPGVTIVSLDGAAGTVIAASDYPRAKTIQLSQLASGAELFLNVATGKADVVFSDSAIAGLFMEANPGMIRKIPRAAPVRVFGNAIVLAQGETRLRRMLDIATDELLQNGTVEKIITRHEKFPGSILRVAEPYKENITTH